MLKIARRAVADPRGTAAGAALLAGGLLAIGCAGGAPPAEDIRVEWALSPTPASVGPVVVGVTLLDGGGRPVRDARLRLEGHMAHPGMVPVIADLREGPPGHYEAHVTFSMGGDWVLLIAGDLADGRRLRRQLEVPGVTSGR